MPCSDSSSSIALRLDTADKFVSFDFVKITCGREISSDASYPHYCLGRSLREIFSISFAQAVEDLNIGDEERQFILYLEWDALRSAIAQYLGIDDKGVDRDRCHISSIVHNEEGVAVTLVMLPPKKMPKIIPCRVSDDELR